VITFIETKLFSRLVEEYLSDDSYRQLQAALASDPEAGPLIPGSGGLRKLRWGISGRGKRSGLRVIYYVRAKQDEIWLLTLYPKNVAENIPSHVLRQIKKEIDDEKDKSS
jgi:mRNA-degrading endonuclease RelE of RelBE toxin-antitoxin system